MADDIQSLKDWKAYYKKRYKETGREAYKKKLKELGEEVETTYLFEYDRNYIQSKGVLMRADAIVMRWEKIKLSEQTALNNGRVIKILNRNYKEMLVTDVEVDYDKNVYIYFEDEFILYRSTGTQGKWELDEEH